MSDFATLERQLGYFFKNPELLKQALTHKSYGKHNYERLEFVGDGILDYVIALNLYHKYPDLAEGDLSKMRAALVNQTALVELAEHIGLGKYLLLGDGERKSGGCERASILADSMEAIFAAVSLDANVDSARGVREFLYKDKLGVADCASIQDSKSMLQEYLQGRQLNVPEYTVIKTTGPDHDGLFHVKCSILDLNVFVVAVGKSKKAASQLAAAEMLLKLNQSTKK